MRVSQPPGKNDMRCKARNKKCTKCGKMGHFEVVCRSSLPCAEEVKEVSEAQSDQGQTFPKVLSVGDGEWRTDKGMFVNIEVGGVPIKFLVDIGSSVTIIDNNLYDKYFSRHALLRTNVTLMDYSKKSINVTGCFTARVKYKDVAASLLMYVVQEGTTLLGLEAVASCS